MWAGLDRQAKSVNTIDETVLNELNDILEKECKGIIFYSLKKSGFIVGADIDAFSKFSTQESAEFIQLGQAVFNKVENLSIPTVAVVDGICLGGGLEFSLACRYRIATNESVVGLPEVLLGIIPAWGGIARSIQRMGIVKALTCLLLPGKNIRAKKALALGLVDVVVPRRELESAAIAFMQHSVIRRRTLLINYISPVIITKLVRSFLKRRINPQHYPAPYAILDIVENSNYSPVDAVKTLIAPNGTARELIRVFYLKERLKHLGDLGAEISPFFKGGGRGDFLPNKGKNIKYVHVAGAGTMGTDIAALCALKGFHVTLSDINVESLGKAFIRVKKYFEKNIYEKSLLQAAYDRFTLDFQGRGIEKADIVIEAIVESLDVKRNFFNEAEKRAKHDALLITNTSSLSIRDISANMKRSERLTGLHFFNPATQMPLVEIIKKDTALELFTETLAFVSQIGKLPVPVSDSPGFLVNRILAPYLVQGLELINEGMEPSIIDEAAKAFGMLMGPIELADTIGLDVCLTVAKNLSQVKEITLLQEKVAAGKLGKKTRSGFFRYNKQERKVLPWLYKVQCQKPSIFDQERIADRLIKTIILEANSCLEGGVVDDKDLLDAAMIFGAGFPPFRGGPMEYAAQLSISSVNNREESEK